MTENAFINIKNRSFTIHGARGIEGRQHERRIIALSRRVWRLGLYI